MSSSVSFGLLGESVMCAVDFHVMLDDYVSIKHIEMESFYWVMRVMYFQDVLLLITSTGKNVL